MKNRFAYTRTFTNLTIAIALVVATVVPALLSKSVVSAGQISQRSVTISSSEVSAASTTYSVSFIPATAGTVEGIVIDFCQDSPLVGVTCTKTNGVSAVPTTGTVTVTQANNASEVYDAVVGTTPQAGRLMLTETVSPLAFTTGATDFVTFSFTATNPSDLGTFYARIITFTDDADALTYDLSSANVNNPGANLDDGGVALSTADQLTVTARVQEQLEFCVAAVETAADETSCTTGEFATPETGVDLGVIDSNTLSRSPVLAANGGNERNGAMVIRTNAFSGATISYFAEQETTSGRLKVAGATCSGSTAFDAGSSITDQCFNSSATPTDFVVNDTEQFGLNINAITDIAGSATPGALDANADYDGITNPDDYAWQQDGTAVEIASSLSVLDYTILDLEFAAQSAATTPTGQYQVISTYIATGTF